MNTMMQALEHIGKPYNLTLFADLAPFKPIVRNNIIVDIYSSDMDSYQNILSMSLFNPNQLFKHKRREVADFNTLQAMFDIYSKLIGAIYTNIDDILDIFSIHNIKVDDIKIIHTNRRDIFSDMIFKCNRYKILVNRGGFICRILCG